MTNTQEVKEKDILIVDDDADIREAIETALQELGNVRIRTVGDGNTAVDMLLKQMPDLLVLDQMLPGKSGFLVLEKIAAHRKEHQGPPVIMITANPGSRHKVYANTLGVDVYLNKPFRMDKLINAAKELLEKNNTK